MSEFFYVSATRKAGSYSLMFGPFPDHAAALIMVDPVQRKASELDPWSDFWAWGTMKLTTEKQPPLGTMNKFYDCS